MSSTGKKGKRTWSTRTVGLLVAVMVFSAMLVLRNLGLMQRLEFFAYDRFLTWRASTVHDEPRIVLIEITEADIRNSQFGGWPVSDTRLASVLELLAAQRPCAVGLDIIRDLPLPADGSQTEELNRALLNHSTIVAGWKFGSADSPGISPPPILRNRPQRIGFHDFPVDTQVDQMVRRGLLYLDDGRSVYESFTLRLALLYLATQGIQPQPGGTDGTQLRLGKTTFRPLEADDGAYINADAHGYQFLLDFRGPKKFQSYSLGQVLGDSLPKQALEEKIVIVGVTAESVKDYIITPLGYEHRGIEVLAQGVNQILRAALDGDRPMKVWQEWQEVLLLFFGCLVGVSLALGISSPWRLGPLIALALLALGLGAWWAFASGWWIPCVSPATGCLISAAVMTSYISHEQRAQRSLLMQLFSKQVSRDVAEKIWAQREEFLQGNRPRSQHLTATVLFADLGQFTPLSERMEPSILMDWLNEYLEAMAQAVNRNGGVVEKYMGDSIMAVFGIPLPRTSEEEIKNDAISAVRCALDMKQALQKLNVSWRQHGLPTTSMGVGIATGPLMAGCLGSEDRMSYTVLGDAVNIAARLEAFEKDKAKFDINENCCRILLSESTIVLLDGRFETELIGRIRLKGKEKEVIVYCAVRETVSDERNLP